MRITRITIENFKRWKNVSTDLKNIDCLVGPNNSGKTSLLQALALFDFCVHHCISKNNGKYELKSRSIAAEDFYVIPCADPKDLLTDRVALKNKQQIIILIRVEFDRSFYAVSKVKLDFNRFSISIDCPDESQDSLLLLKESKISYLPVFSTFLTEEERKTPAVIEDALTRGRVNSVIRNLLLDLKEKQAENELLSVLQRLFPELQDISIRFDELNDRYIKFNYREYGRQKEFDVFLAGSGFQQFVYLFGFIHLRKPTVILLDEPDVHLHGTLQRGLLSELNRLVDAGKQVLIATHSQDLISGIPPENILYVENNKVTRLAIKYDVYDALIQMGSIDPAQVPIVQAWKKVLIVENQSDFELISIFCETILTASLWAQIRRRLAVCYAHGNPWTRDMITLRKQLQQMFIISGETLKMFVIADRDYHPDREELMKELQSQSRSQHIEWHIWVRTEIENYLLDLSSIKKIVNRDDNQMTLFENILEKEFFKLLDLSKDYANDRLVKAFLEYSKKYEKGWDISTFSKKAREYLNAHWEKEKIGLADAKDKVLPGLKQWLMENGYGQFSNISLAKNIPKESLPQELHELTQKLVLFTGIKKGKDKL